MAPSRPGPVVTMFEFLPAAGVKVSRIASLADDLAMAMEALRVRIVAPIPGRGVVGIEGPNKERQMVVLRELAEQEAFQKAHSKTRARTRSASSPTWCSSSTSWRIC